MGALSAGWPLGISATSLHSTPPQLHLFVHFWISQPMGDVKNTTYMFYTVYGVNAELECVYIYSSTVWLLSALSGRLIS